MQPLLLLGRRRRWSAGSPGPCSCLPRGISFKPCRSFGSYGLLPCPHRHPLTPPETLRPLQSAGRDVGVLVSWSLVWEGNSGPGPRSWSNSDWTWQSGHRYSCSGIEIGAMRAIVKFIVMGAERNRVLDLSLFIRWFVDGGLIYFGGMG